MDNADANNPNSINATTLDADGKGLNIDPRNPNAKGATTDLAEPHRFYVKSVALAKQLFDAIKNVAFNRNRVNFHR